MLELWAGSTKVWEGTKDTGVVNQKLQRNQCTSQEERSEPKQQIKTREESSIIELLCKVRLQITCKGGEEGGPDALDEHHGVGGEGGAGAAGHHPPHHGPGPGHQHAALGSWLAGVEGALGSTAPWVSGDKLCTDS